MKIEEEIQHIKFRNIYQKTIINLYVTNNIIQAKFLLILQQFDLSQQQFNILRILRGQLPNSANIGLLKERMLDKSSDVSRIVERLRIKKLVTRRLNKNNRRQMDVKITEAGLALLRNIDGVESKLDGIVSGLTENELKLFNEMLDKIRE